MDSSHFPELCELVQMTKQFFMQDQAFPELMAESPPICLVLIREQPDHRQFLEKVAQAITDNFAPAVVIYAKNQKDVPEFKLIIGEKKDAKIHELISSPGSTPCLTLAPLDSYLENVDLKRDLWTKLKTLPFQDLLR